MPTNFYMKNFRNTPGVSILRNGIKPRSIIKPLYVYITEKLLMPIYTFCTNVDTQMRRAQR